MIVIVFSLIVLFGPTLLLLSIGLAKRSTDPRGAKVFFILAAVYLLISGGICASQMTNFRL
jgi:hypothetical protein